MRINGTCAKGFYLVTTDHLCECIWFRDEEDFRAGMNAVPIIACPMSIKVVAFILMSNHVHFLLYCTRDEAERFIAAYKGFHSRYMHCKYGIREMLRENHAEVQRIGEDGESVEWVIAYIHMNFVAANICLSSTDYPWGTGDAFFRSRPCKGIALGTFSVRARTRLLHSAKVLPAGMLVGEDGFILPASYVDVKYVEARFQTPKRMLYFLKWSSKARKFLGDNAPEYPNFRDQILVAAISDLCHSLFRKESISDLNDQQLAELLRQLRFRFSSYAEQLARVCGIPYTRVTTLLDAPI
ncbi:MAG: hypothetical protein IJM00_07140 [Bacteroidales bacterium]|nr:hypothetical protein [Bacteroidales bacterium]